MKKLMALVVLTGCLAIPSFAGDVVGHSAKVAGKESAKVATVTAKDTAKSRSSSREVSLLTAIDRKDKSVI